MNYDTIIDDICDNYGVKKEHLLSRRRDKELVKVRKFAYSLLRKQGLSFPKIGKLMNKHHTTVMKVLRDDKKSC